MNDLRCQADRWNATRLQRNTTAFHKTAAHLWLSPSMRPVAKPSNLLLTAWEKKKLPSPISQYYICLLCCKRHRKTCHPCRVTLLSHLPVCSIFSHCWNRMDLLLYLACLVPLRCAPADIRLVFALILPLFTTIFNVFFLGTIQTNPNASRYKSSY